MNTRKLLVSLAALSLGLCLSLRAADAPDKPQPGAGFLVVTEISFDEQGTPVDAKVVQSDDPTGDHTLEQLAMRLSEQDKQPPRLQDGKPVKFKARRPFKFPVEDDEGAAANEHRPTLRAGNQAIPAYPESLAAKDETGGAIVELTIQSDGKVKAVRTLRASHPEFSQAAETALAQWVFNPSQQIAAPAETRWRAAVAFTTKGRDVDLKWRLAPRPSIGGFIVGRAPPAATPEVSLPAVPAEKK